MLKKIKSKYIAKRFKDESGAEIVQVILVLGFALLLGAALLLVGDQLAGLISTAGTQLSNLFGNMTDGVPPAP